MDSSLEMRLCMDKYRKINN